MAFSSSCSCTHKYLIITLLLVFSMFLRNVKNCNAFQTFGFEMHHRFSDHVKSIMGGYNLLEIGSRGYYAAMAHQDKVFHGRALAENDNDDSKLLTFSNGDTYSNSFLGPLHYANVSLGTPSLSFLVALDAGTNLLWVPCDCAECIPSTSEVVCIFFLVPFSFVVPNLGNNYYSKLNNLCFFDTSTTYNYVFDAYEINLNIYSINSSSMRKDVFCNSSLCDQLQKGCSELSSQCPYKVAYNEYVNSSGVLVEDILRLKMYHHNPKDIDARITFGCGKVQTGYYLDGKARNGLFGLGIGKTSVPSILSIQGLISDSFSMCFGFDGVGKITFGDQGARTKKKHQLITGSKKSNLSCLLFSLLSCTGVSDVDLLKHILHVGGNLSDELDVTAIFYSGAEYTYLSDPAYTALCDSFDSQTLHKRHSFEPDDLLEYCYDVSLDIPNVTLIMKGGSKFNVYYPMVPMKTNGTVTALCLGVLKNTNGNFIGNNFMTGHHIVFDRVKMMLGWKASNCTDKIPQNPTSLNGGTAGTPKNGLNFNAPQFSVGKQRNLNLIVTSLLCKFEYCIYSLFYLLKVKGAEKLLIQTVRRKTKC
ncbi:hypothetical protein MKW92_033643 [Papaver armeniacum]|nr:hypothetical protein MKW92_033643 [Papaver armeniacum]